ncbi:MAG: Bax inhibitor-1/YccA family protein [Alphaproteobacteria bacterium]
MSDLEMMRAQQRAVEADAIAAQTGEMDEGLRAYMLSVYNYMTIGLALTGLFAFGVSRSPELMNLIYTTPLQWVLIFGTLGMVFFFAAKVHTLKPATAQAIFWAYAALNGVTLSAIFVIYTGESLTQVFLISAAMFGSLSLFGYTTKRDLSGMGKFLFMGLIGLVVASIANLFIGSSVLQFAVSVIGVLVFAGLTVYDTQKIKSEYWYHANAEDAQRGAIRGALHLYLDFINLFLMMLRLFGTTRD